MDVGLFSTENNFKDESSDADGGTELVKKWPPLPCSTSAWLVLELQENWYSENDDGKWLVVFAGAGYCNVLASEANDVLTGVVRDIGLNDVDEQEEARDGGDDVSEDNPVKIKQFKSVKDLEEFSKQHSNCQC